MRARGITLSIVLVCAGQLSAQIGTRVAPVVSVMSAEDGTQTVANVPSETLDSTGTAPAACGNKTGKFPLKDASSTTTLCFWDQLGQDFLKYVRFNTSEKSMAMQSDMVTDAFRNIRVTFGAAVAATTEDDPTTTTPADPDEPTANQDKILNLLKTNGGNLSLAASYPIYYKPFAGEAQPIEGGEPTEVPSQGYFLWNSYLRFAGNVDAMGGDTDESTVDVDDFNGNVELSFTEMQVDLLSFRKDFNLLGYFNASAVVGTEKFCQSIGTDVSRAFLKGTIGAGMRIANRMTVYFTYAKYSDGDIPGDGGAITLVLNQ